MGLKSRLYDGLRKLYEHKTKIPVNKWADKLSRQFSEKKNKNAQ